MDTIDLLEENNDCGRALLRILSRGHTITAELHRAADDLPKTLVSDRFQEVLPDFSVFRSAGALEKIAQSADLIELDEESREVHVQPVQRLFRLLDAIRKYAADLCRFIDELESGVYTKHNLEIVVGDTHGAQLLCEALALLGALLLLLEERIPGSVRERALVAFHRFTVGTNEASDDFSEVCELFKATGCPSKAEFATRRPGYPESFFSRFQLPIDAVKMVISQMQTGDVYNASQHYKLAEHRSHSLASQAGLLYTVLFFHSETLESDNVAMREIVNRHFGDTWIVAYALGSTADLLEMWAPYKAAHKALKSAITPSNVKDLQDLHSKRLIDTKQQLAEYLTEGVLTKELVVTKMPSLLNCLRQANTTIRWMLLQPQTRDQKLLAVLQECLDSKEQILRVLVDTALLEDRIKKMLIPLVAQREATWSELKSLALQALDDLAVYFSGEHPLMRNVRNQELEEWFRGLQSRIEDLSYSTREEALSLGRKVSQILRALEEVEHFHKISQQPQILHFLASARGLLQQMLQTVNLRQGSLETIDRVADLSYAWEALSDYQQAMGTLLRNSPGSVKGLRALFLKLASILEMPLRRIRQSKNENHENLVAQYYSSKLVAFMRSVLQEIPRMIFDLLGQISACRSARPPEPLPPRMSLKDLNDYAQRSEEGRYAVTRMTQEIALLMRGIRETDVVLLGVMRVEPRNVLADGLRRELVTRVKKLFAGLVFTPSPRTKQDLVEPVDALAKNANSLRRAFEHVQDYVGANALQLWHTELVRITRYLLHMEQQEFLRPRHGKHFAFKLSAYYDRDCPIEFPDSLQAAPTGGSSFISRTVQVLHGLTDPKVATGGFRGEWRSLHSGEIVLDSLSMETLYQALGPAGLQAVSQLLGLRTVKYMRKIISGTRKGITLEATEILRDMSIQAIREKVEFNHKLQAAAQSLTSVLGPLVDALSVVGQYQLLRQSIHHTLQLHARLEAPMAVEALGALDSASLMETADIVVSSSDLPQDVLEFCNMDESSLQEAATGFQNCLAHAVDLPGHSNPFRQIYTTMPDKTCPTYLNVLLALTLVYASSPSHRGNSRNLLHRSSLKSATAVEDQGVELSPVHSAGIATLLQHLPQEQLNGMLELLGCHIAGICSASSPTKESLQQGVQMLAPTKESLQQGAHILAAMMEVLELLALPREHLAEFVPQGLLDLWCMD